MAIEIDEMETRVSVRGAAPETRGAGVTPPGGLGGPASPAAAPVRDPALLLETLRPLVQQILREELEAVMRARGVR